MANAHEADMTPDTPTQAAALPELPEPVSRIAHGPAVNFTSVQPYLKTLPHGRYDCYTAGQMRAYAQQAVREACAERDALREAKENEVAALALLARMRQACGDDGARMQDELEQYLRGLRADAERYRWLRTPPNNLNAAIYGPTGGLLRRDEYLDAAIDLARKEGA